jgi:hypothetical protein
VDLDETLYGCDGIQYYFDYVPFNTVASTIPNLRTFKLLWWVQILNLLVDLDGILYGVDDVEGDSDSILLNLVAATIPKRRALNFLGGRNF